MSGEALDALLRQLSGGDAHAAEEAFRAYEPYLRKVVRRLLPSRLRPKFDSADVVQSVWADLFHDFATSGRQFADAEHLRAFLVKATRHRFIDRVRQNQTAADREQSLDGAEADAVPQSREPRPSEVAQADELWERLLGLCPPEHAEVLRLRRQGLSAAEVAARTGLHEDSVRRILRDLARRLAFRDAAADEPG